MCPKHPYTPCGEGCPGYDAPLHDTNDPNFWIRRGQCPTHFHKLPCTRCSPSKVVVRAKPRPEERPWEKAGWTREAWDSFAWACAQMDTGSALSRITGAFGPNEADAPNLSVRTAFIELKQFYEQERKEDEALKQKQYDQDARMRKAAREKADREDAQRRIDGQLTPQAEAFLEKLRAGLKSPEALDEMDDPEPIIDGWLYTDSINYLAGPSGTFKTFIAHDLAARYGSQAMTYHGIPMTHGAVLYIIAEGAGMFKYRKQAWESHNGKVRNVTYYPAPVQLSDFEEQMPALLALARNDGYKMIVFDTQAMCTVGDDENQARDMGRIVNACHQLREATGGCVLLVHHFDKGGNGMRGSGSQFAAASTVLATVRKGDEEWVRLSTKKSDGGKAKEDEGRDDIRFKMEKWEPDGLDVKGRPRRGSLYPLRDDAVGARQEVIYTPTVDVERAGILTLLEANDAVGGVSSTGVKEFLNENFPRPNGTKPYTASGAESRIAMLITNKTAEKPGSRFRITDLGREVLCDGNFDE